MCDLYDISFQFKLSKFKKKLKKDKIREIEMISS